MDIRENKKIPSDDNVSNHCLLARIFSKLVACYLEIPWKFIGLRFEINARYFINEHKGQKFSMELDTSNFKKTFFFRYFRNINIKQRKNMHGYIAFVKLSF
jgi:hypothetical protein